MKRVILLCIFAAGTASIACAGTGTATVTGRIIVTKTLTREVKRIVSPRWYAAARVGYQKDDYLIYDGVESASSFLPGRQVCEFALGFRPNRLMLVKAGYEWVNVAGGTRGQDNVFGVQFVTSINSISRAFK